MKKEKTYFLVLFFTYLILLTLKKTEFYFPVISDHAADLICIPLSLTSIIGFFHITGNKSFEIGRWHILVAVVYFSVVFEWLMPAHSNNYVADPIDILCYLAGGIFYEIIFTKKKSAKSIEPG